MQRANIYPARLTYEIYRRYSGVTQTGIMSTLVWVTLKTRNGKAWDYIFDLKCENLVVVRRIDKWRSEAKDREYAEP